jgi:hypothetical protein
MTTTSRVAHSFNLFGLPPLLVYEIRVPPHVYLLTALIVYLIGPPALIPIVAAFFFYRWHLQQKHATWRCNMRMQQLRPHTPSHLEEGRLMNPRQRKDGWVCRRDDHRWE